MRIDVLERSHVAVGGIINLATVAMAVMVLWQVPSVVLPTYAISTTQTKPKKAIIGTPTHLNIASIGVNLPVGEGAYNASNGSWSLSDSSALYATNTVPLNDSNGTTLIYGHGTEAVFASLDALKKGDKAQVKSQKGSVFTYSYVSRHDVDPSDTSVFAISGSPKLVLQTCDGPWDSVRALYSFKLVKVSHDSRNS